MNTVLPIALAALTLAASQALAQKPSFECPGGMLRPTTAAPLAGRAFDLRDQPELMARHAALTRGEAPWVVDLQGPSSANRTYLSQDGGPPVVVFDSCKPHDCADHQLYGAIQEDRYGLVLLVRGQPRTLGDMTGTLRAAVDCARAQDDEERRRNLEAIRQLVMS